MKLNKTTARALILSACILCITTFSYAQSKTYRVNTPAPIVTKGYYSIYNNVKKLDYSASRTAFSGKGRELNTYESKMLPAPQKGYYSIKKNAERRREQMAKDSFYFFNEAPSGINTKSPFPVIGKGYYSIGNNADKLRK